MTTMKAHRHHAISERTSGWTCCVAPDRCPSARTHGNVVITETCACGAQRSTEINGGARVASAWAIPATPQRIDRTREALDAARPVAR